MHQRSPTLFNPVLIVGCVIIVVSFAVRASFGVFQIPIAAGLILSANSTTPIEHQTYAWLVGFGIAGTGF